MRGDWWLYFPKDLVCTQNHCQARQSLAFGGGLAQKWTWLHFLDPTQPDPCLSDQTGPDPRLKWNSGLDPTRSITPQSFGCRKNIAKFQCCKKLLPHNIFSRMDPTRPDPCRSRNSVTRLQPDPTHGWTRPVSNCELGDRSHWFYRWKLRHCGAAAVACLLVIWSQVKPSTVRAIVQVRCNAMLCRFELRRLRQRRPLSISWRISMNI